MKRAVLSLGLMLLPGLALAQSQTGYFCNQHDRIVSTYRGRDPGHGFVAVGGGWFHRDTGRSCSGIADTLPVFDAGQYLALNPDVRAAGIDPLAHWRANGKAEGRMPSLGFAPREYLSQQLNPDLRKSLGSDWPAGIARYAASGFFDRRPTRLGADGPNIHARIFDSDRPPPGDVYDHPFFSNIANGGAAPDNTLFRTGMDTSVITGLPNTGTGIKGPGNQDIVDGVTGFNGLQEYGGQFGIGIDTRAIKTAFDAFEQRANKGQPFGLTATTIATTPRLRWRPWRDGKALDVQVEVRLPFAGGTNGGGSHLDTYVTLRDTVTGTAFIWGVTAFDTRPGMLDGAVIDNQDTCGPTCTGLSIFTVPLRRGSPYLTVAADNTVEAGHATWKDARMLHVRLTAGNLRNLIAHARQIRPAISLSDDPAAYEVTYWNLNPEVFAPLDANGRSTGDGWIGIGGRILNAGPA
ncbi:hypothetical protein [Methylobacterium nigriterrae]|uniref:hypothetical protein n=1 Tax=Methylobacterium nigriterrae TaxID=3127512 RepID=UPI003013867B